MIVDIDSPSSSQNNSISESKKTVQSSSNTNQRHSNETILECIRSEKSQAVENIPNKDLPKVTDSKEIIEQTNKQQQQQCENVQTIQRNRIYSQKTYTVHSFLLFHLSLSSHFCLAFFD